MFGTVSARESGDGGGVGALVAVQVGTKGRGKGGSFLMEDQRIRKRERQKSTLNSGDA